MRYRAQRLSPVIPTASMADIAFLLIIFFMYATTFSLDGTTVDLPESLIQQDVQKDAAIVAITAENEIWVSDGVEKSVRMTSEQELRDSIADIVTRFPGRQFIIKCDTQTPYENFNRIYEILIENNATNVSLLTEQKYQEAPR
ncbi:MAG: biopolymer transporter ExbD [Acidobacteria bacterium]|nr:biopolymer transporter ExbD [Acidobacteriota bacterium]